MEPESLPVAFSLGIERLLTLREFSLNRYFWQSYGSFGLMYLDSDGKPIYGRSTAQQAWESSALNYFQTSFSDLP